MCKINTPNTVSRGEASGWMTTCEGLDGNSHFFFMNLIPEKTSKTPLAFANVPDSAKSWEGEPGGCVAGKATGGQSHVEGWNCRMVW